MTAELSEQNGEHIRIGPRFKKTLPLRRKLQCCLQTIHRYILEEDVICLHIITYGKHDGVVDVNSNLRRLALH